MPRRRRELRPGTAKRYEWMVRNYIAPVVGDLQLTALRAEHLDRLYTDLVDRGAADGGPLASKTVYDVHVVIRSALRYAARCRLVDHNVAARRPTTTAHDEVTAEPRDLDREQLAHFLDATSHLRLHPALHLAATTGMRRGELAGLRWGDWQLGHPSSVDCPQPSKHQRPRRRDPHQDRRQPTLHRPRPQHRDTSSMSGGTRQRRDGHPGRRSATRCSPARSANRSTPNRSPSSSTAKLRGSGCRGSDSTTCATPTRHCSSPPATPIKVVSERLGHAHPGFTMATYQHLLPGMGATAAHHFAALLAGAGAPPTR